MEGVGDGVIQPDIMVERDACKPRQRRRPSMGRSKSQMGMRTNASVKLVERGKTTSC